MGLVMGLAMSTHIQNRRSFTRGEFVERQSEFGTTRRDNAMTLIRIRIRQNVGGNERLTVTSIGPGFRQHQSKSIDQTMTFYYIKLMLWVRCGGHLLFYRRKLLVIPFRSLVARNMNIVNDGIRVGWRLPVAY